MWFAWLAVAMAAPLASSDFYVWDLPGLPDDAYFPIMHAGVIPLSNDTDDGLFFWSVNSKYQVTDTPKTMFWLNGGPGCSSMDGAMLEMGPFRVDADTGDLRENKGTWTDYVNMVFVDQPLGVGFSSSASEAYANNITEASDQFVDFLAKYIETFPEVLASDIYLGGESYAGQYLPYIWKSLRDSDTLLDIAGIFMGNPWLDPAHQYPSYAQFVKKYGLIDEKDMPGLDNVLNQCMKSLESADVLSPKNQICDQMYQYITEHSMHNTQTKCFNVYKYTDESPFPQCGMEWPLELPQLTKYLSREDVQQALNVENLHKSWEECSTQVSRHFVESGVNASSLLMPEILESTPVMVAIGDLDFICNGLGLEQSFKNMEWSGRTGLQDVEGEELMFGGLSAGAVRTDRNLTIGHLYNGSHMLPVDLQFESRMLLHKFVGITENYNALETPPTASQPSPTNSTTPSATPTGPTASEDEINEATRRAYARAGVTALIVVAVVGLVVFLLWRRDGAGITFAGFFKAVLHTGLPKRKPADYIQLRNRRPDIILEEEEDQFDV